MADMPELGELKEVDLRQVWPHEAQNFTPWLAENLHRLSDAVDMELELIETEKAVENFAADILARDVASGALVLIENQLEKTDHAHLGQILTYLAGLEAKAVIWISPRFQEPHLSAVRWLNDHTSDEFAFFAVRVRAVRIGNSPIAPVFEVLAQPSDWERTLRQRAGKGDAYSETRLRFWTFYCERHPAAVEDGLKPNRHWNAWFQVNEDIWITLGIGTSFASVFVRGDWGERKFSALERLQPHLEKISERLPEVEIHENHREGWVFGETNRQFSYLNEEQWPEICDWLEEHRQRYAQVIREVLAGKS